MQGRVEFRNEKKPCRLWQGREAVGQRGLGRLLTTGYGRLLLQFAAPIADIRA